MACYANRRRNWPVLAAAVWLIVLSIEQAAADPIGIANTEDLRFGRFAAGAGGTVIVSTSGALSATGGIILPASSTGSAAHFTVSGDPDFIYSIALPPNDEVTLTSGAHDMPVQSFVSNPSGSGQLSPGGTQILAIGATLVVSGGQVPGNYSGSFSVTVAYE